MIFPDHQGMSLFLWTVYYGFWTSLSLGFSKGFDFEPGLKSINGYEMYGSPEEKRRSIESFTGLNMDETLREDIFKYLMKRDLDKSVSQLLVRALEDVSTFNEGDPTGVLFHRTLQKIKEPIRKNDRGVFIDSRIRAIPQYRKMDYDSVDSQCINSFRDNQNDMKSSISYTAAEKANLIKSILSETISKLNNKYGNDLEMTNTLKKRHDNLSKYVSSDKKNSLIDPVIDDNMLNSYINRLYSMRNIDFNDASYRNKYKELLDNEGDVLNGIMKHPSQSNTCKSSKNDFVYNGIISKAASDNEDNDVLDRFEEEIREVMRNTNLHKSRENQNHLIRDKSNDNAYKQVISKPKCRNVTMAKLIDNDPAVPEFKVNDTSTESSSDPDPYGLSLKARSSYTILGDKKVLTTNSSTIKPYLRIHVKNGPVELTFVSEDSSNSTKQRNLKSSFDPSSICFAKLSNNIGSPVKPLTSYKSTYSLNPIIYGNLIGRLIDENDEFESNQPFNLSNFKIRDKTSHIKSVEMSSMNPTNSASVGSTTMVNVNLHFHKPDLPKPEFSNPFNRTKLQRDDEITTTLSTPRVTSTILPIKSDKIIKAFTNRTEKQTPKYVIITKYDFNSTAAAKKNKIPQLNLSDINKSDVDLSNEDRDFIEHLANEIEKELQLEIPQMIEDTPVEMPQIVEHSKEIPQLIRNDSFEVPQVVETNSLETPNMFQRTIEIPEIVEKECINNPVKKSSIENSNIFPEIIEIPEIIGKKLSGNPELFKKNSKEIPKMFKEIIEIPEIVENECLNNPQLIQKNSIETPNIFQETIKIPEMIIVKKLTDNPQVVKNNSIEIPEKLENHCEEIPQVIGKDFIEIPQIFERIRELPQLLEKDSKESPQLVKNESIEIPCMFEKSKEIPLLIKKDSIEIPQIFERTREIPQLIEDNSKEIPLNVKKNSMEVPQLSENDFIQVPLLIGKNSIEIPNLSQQNYFIPQMAVKNISLQQNSQANLINSELNKNHLVNINEDNLIENITNNKTNRNFIQLSELNDKTPYCKIQTNTDDKLSDNFKNVCYIQDIIKKCLNSLDLNNTDNSY